MVSSNIITKLPLVSLRLEMGLFATSSFSHDLVEIPRGLYDRLVDTAFTA